MINFNKTAITFLSLILGAITFLSCDNSVDEKNVLNVNPETIALGYVGDSAIINIETSKAWALTNSDDWLSFDILEGEGNAIVNVQAAENLIAEERKSIISIESGVETITVEVSQAAYDEWDGFPFENDPDETDMRTLTMAELQAEMSVGWNIGNTLDAIGGETAWGNPMITQKLIDSVKAAGFNFIRLPVAWSKFSDEGSYIIKQDWLNRVEEVVNYILNNDMYVMVNIHWDEGWMDHPYYDKQNEINYRIETIWKQIARHFKDYGDHLLFAGTNEVHVEGDYGNPSKENYTVQNSFNQTFVTTVRGIGGKNAYRYLIVQGYNTNIDHAVKYATIPEDVIDGRLLMEVHYYDPYNFSLNESVSVTQWGKIATDPSKTETWANEAFVDAQFKKMKSNFFDKGIGVVMGEYGAIEKPGVEDHEIYREYYLEYVTSSAIKHNMVPVYWDNGASGTNGFALFNRKTGEQLKPNMVKAIVSAVE